MPTKTVSALRPSTPIPEDLSYRHGLFALYFLQHWESFAQRYAHDPLPPSYFYGHIWDVLTGLANTTRKTVLKHLESHSCAVCDTRVDYSHSQLDHLLPTSTGGSDDLSNLLILCRRCNSSKGAKDLLQWWQDKAYPVNALSGRVLCLYARAQWQQQPPLVLGERLPKAQRSFLLSRAEALPTDVHRHALYGASYAGCAFWYWSQQKGAL